MRELGLLRVWSRVANKWLPSEMQWINSISESIMDGRVVYTRSIPRWGISSVCLHLKETLGDSAILVPGKEISETNQRDFRERIDRQVDEVIAEHGYAQLIFDDYGRAIRRSQGQYLHSVLYRILIDSQNARDTGALLVANSSEALDYKFSGSPLISRAKYMALPVITPDDAFELGSSVSEIHDDLGESTWLARRGIGVSRRERCLSAVEHLNNDWRKILNNLPPSAVEVLAGARIGSDLDSVSAEPLRCFGSFDADSVFRPSAAVLDSKFIDQVHAQNPGWPADFQDSVHEFADLVRNVDEAIWVDRYLLENLDSARSFLIELQKISSVRLRLLVSNNNRSSEFKNEIKAKLGDLPDISVSLMSPSDRRKLHDRHLIFPKLTTGYAIPTADVIFARIDPGSAMHTLLPNFAIDYTQCWAHGEKVMA